MPQGLLNWYHEIHHVRGKISQLQATINQVVAATPSVDQYKELIQLYGSAAGSDPLADKLHALLISPQLKVAVRLKTLFDLGRLPFLLLFTTVQFKSPRCDRQVGILLDHTPGDKSAAEPANQAHSATSDTDHKSAALYPPMLPPLEDPSLLRLVLTDKSMRQPSDFLQLELLCDFNNNHNRKLARHGAALLDCALVDLLDDMFPKAHELDLQYLQLRLTALHVVAKLAYCYNLADAVHHHVSAQLPVDDKLRILRTVFLAYVGAMARSDYLFADIKAWLAKLYHPLVAKLADDCRATHKLRDVHEVAYAEFQFLMTRANNYFQTPTKKMRYDFVAVEDDPPVYELHVGDLALASGTGSTAMAAKHRAAYNTLDDRELRTKLLAHILEFFRVPETQHAGAEVKCPEKENSGTEHQQGQKSETEHPETERSEQMTVGDSTDNLENTENDDSENKSSVPQDFSDDEAYSPEMVDQFATTMTAQHALTALEQAEGLSLDQLAAPAVHRPDSGSAGNPEHVSGLAGHYSDHPGQNLGTPGAGQFVPGQALGHPPQAQGPPAHVPSGPQGHIPAGPAGQLGQYAPAYGNWASKGSAPAAAPRMPLPYGMLPPIPNIKKRGAEKRR